MSKKRIIIKIGTNVITNADGLLDMDFIERLSGELSEIISGGCEIVLVSSGAIGAGAGKLNLKTRPKALAQKQAIAAVGQVLLMHAYEKCFGRHNINVAQVLLTREDLEIRSRYLNARNTLNTLLSMNIIPIVNENDTVSVEEIQFGDNDTLSAIIAAKLEADYLIMLTDVDGLYMGNPKHDKECKIIQRIEKITPELEKYICGKSGSVYSVGGMLTKVRAAKAAVSSGVTVFIVNGKKSGVIKDVLENKNIGSCFVPAQRGIKARKRWIAFGVRIKGKILVDNGAAKAIVQGGKSLLPSGIIDIEGNFSIGDSVCIISPEKEEIARGIVSFNSDEILQIKGKKSNKIKEILNKDGIEEVIHRNNLVIISDKAG
ncbi:MAG: glutamate 5-kinase [bacterium]